MDAACANFESGVTVKPFLSARNLSKVFHPLSEKTQGVQVFQDLNLDVFPGDRIAIIGKSGAGKSTLLHLLGTLESPSSGTVFFEEKDIFRLSESELSAFRNRTLGFVFQFHYLMLEFTALENVMMPALLGNVPKKEARSRAEMLLVKVGLRDRLAHKPSQLSGGEQQRVAIARSLMMRPKLLLTDEMTGNLDPVTGLQIFELIQTLHEEFRIALVSVTHDSKLAATYPKVWCLEKGKLK